jgi:uncharacterized protein YneF (UPF0154 family)
MARKLLISVLLGVVVCGVAFYLGYFLALIVAALFGPLNPADTPALQAWLRHLMVPVSLAVGCVAAVLTYRRMGQEEEKPQPEKSR